MKFYLLPVLLIASSLTSNAQGLTDADREEILKKIEAIQQQADSMVDKKYQQAMSAFSSAMDNENEALELYLKCEELLNFEKKNKKAADFRDWKKNNQEKHLEAGFRLALQYQLRWLVLSLKATSENADREKLAIEASKILDDLVKDAEALAPHQAILNQNALSSIFAQAYQINGIEIKNWPAAPGSLETVYNNLILPPLRRADRINHLTTFWQKRINQEAELVLKWKSNGKGKSGEASLEQEKFNNETLPQLRWEAEVDVFKVGDQRGASDRMLKLIQENITHKSAPKWIESFADLVKSNSNLTKSAQDETPAKKQDP